MQRLFKTCSYFLLVGFLCLLSCDTPTSVNENWVEFRLPGWERQAWEGYVTDIYFSGPSDGWVCTKGGYIYHFDGTDWVISAYFEAVYDNPEGKRYFEIYDLDFSTPDDGWAVARASDYPHKSGIFHFDGETWSDVTPEIAGNYGMYSVCAVAPDDVWFGAAGGILVHYDGDSYQVYPETFGGNKIWAIQFVDENFGVAMGDGNLILYDGSSWRYDVFPICNFNFPRVGYPGGLSFTSRDDGWIVSYWEGGRRSNSIALHFDGDSWTEVSIPGGHPLNDVYFKDREEGWIVGADAWKNNGEEWTTVPLYPVANCVWVTETDDVWVGCTGVLILKYKG